MWNSQVQKKNRPEKFPFIASSILIVLAVRWPVKYFSAPNFLIFWKSVAEEGQNGISKSIRFTRKRNNYSK